MKTVSSHSVFGTKYSGTTTILRKASQYLVPPPPANERGIKPAASVRVNAIAATSSAVLARQEAITACSICYRFFIVRSPRTDHSPRVKQKTEEFLNFMLWNCDRLLNPSFRNLSGPFEAWCQRTGANRHLDRLEQRQLIETRTEPDEKRLLRLTQAGRTAFFGNRDPREHWDRQWDGQWRMIMFDLRLDQNTERQRLRRYLHSRGFGVLQKSVWVTPHPLADEAKLLAETKVNAKSMIFLHARPAAGETDEEIVTTTWDFDQINGRWKGYLDHLETLPRTSLQSERDTQAFYDWTVQERQQWQRAIAPDPLLPKPICPPGYLGEKAWTLRQKAMATTSKTN